MITMTQIAKLVGVSQATVSRVLSGNASVKSDIKEKVLACAKEHDYQPNIIAQSLVGNKTNLLGMVVTDISNPFFAELVKAIEEEASAKGYSIMLFNTDYKRDKEEKYLALLKRYQVDGVLLVPCCEEESYIKNLEKYSLPLVSVTMNLETIDSVYICHMEAGAKVAKHMLGMGYESFLFIGGSEDKKEIGFKQALSEAGIDIAKHYCSIHTDTNKEYTKLLIDRIHEEQNTDGIGIFANNDVQALTALEILHSMQAEVPERVALAGFDNTFLCKITTPAITSVAQPIEEIGRLSLERLIEKIENVHVDGKCIQYQLEARLIPRASTVKAHKKIRNKI